MKFYIKFIFFYFLLGFWFSFIITNNAFSQEPAAEEEFNDLGLISYSNNYKVAPELDHITFRIRNQSTLTINKIFAWVYHISKTSKSQNYLLASKSEAVNTTHKKSQIKFV